MDDVLEGIEWTLDCQGKQDFDADLVRLSSRFYPRGGGFAIITRNENGEVKIEDNDARPEVKPSAVSSIYFRDKQIAERWFDGVTEAEVKAQVEAWAREQIARLEDVVLIAFKKRKGNT